MKNNYLFNFSASFGGGGFKRLYAYAKWFNQNGGAWFLIHANCHALINEFPNNRFTIANQSKFQRLVNDCGYLRAIQKEINKPDLYYSYGIPIYYKLGRVNWFHLSNVLPLVAFKGIPIALFDKIKLSYLGRRIKNNYKNADICSAESDFSLSLINSDQCIKRVVAVNGGDDEILLDQTNKNEKKNPIAIVVGTYRYKSLNDAYAVFEWLREKDHNLKLMIIGNEQHIPSNIKKHNHVILKGILQQNEVINYLQTSKYYISTTYIENSYNAASEGIFFAEESYISDIGPHRELMTDLSFERISVPKMKRPMLHIKKDNLSVLNLKTWDTVIKEMIRHACV